MIYFGVQLLPQAFKIVALSQGFALIDDNFRTPDSMHKNSLNNFPNKSG